MNFKDQVKTAWETKELLDIVEDWYLKSNLNGYQVMESNGWEIGFPLHQLGVKFKRVIFVENDIPHLDSVKKELEIFIHPETHKIFALLEGVVVK